MTRALAIALCAAVVAAGVQTWRLERVQRHYAVAEAEAASALAKQRADAAATITALRGDFEEIMEKANALPDADACGLDAGRVRALDAIR